MKKTIIIFAATAALIAVGASGVANAYAASVTPTQWDSTGTVAFTSNTTTPPNITNPETPKPGGPGVAGALAIDYASDLDFGSHQISASQATYYAKPDTTAFSGTSVADFVEMHDLRGLGTGNNTQLSVKQLAQFSNGSKDLTGAALTFASAKGANTQGGTYVPTSVAGYTLTPGTAQNVLSTNGTVGQYLTSYGVASDYKGTEAGGPISLSVPSGSALAGSYTATLEWDLTTAP